MMKFKIQDVVAEFDLNALPGGGASAALLLIGLGLLRPGSRRRGEA